MEGLECQNKEVKSHYEDSCESVVISNINVISDINVLEKLGGHRSNPTFCQAFEFLK